MASLIDLRQNLFDQVDWDPAASNEGVRRANVFIDRAVQQISLDAPFLFHESEVRFRTQANAEPTLSTDRLQVITDTSPLNTPVNPWVLKTLIDRTTTDAVDWANDRTWDGRWIDLKDNTTGVTVHRTRIQSVSHYADSGNPRVKITLERPIDHSQHGTGPFNWIVYTPVYWLKDNIIEMKSARLLDDSNRAPMGIIGQPEAEEYSIVGLDEKDAPGTPSYLFRRGREEMPTPNSEPDVELGDETSAPEKWIGPEPPGKFSYRFTLTWGKRDSEYQSRGMGWYAGGANTWTTSGPASGASSTSKGWSENRFKEPLWESAPSPESDEITLDVPALLTSDIGGVKLTLPNIPYMLGFGANGVYTGGANYTREHDGLSGWHVRIYRRRHTADFTNYEGWGTAKDGQKVTNLAKLDIQDAYFLLAELPLDRDNEGVFWDLGDIIPDYRRRLRDVHGYQGIQFHPFPDAVYDVAIRVVERPPRLVSDSDTPQINAEAQDLILFKAASYLYESLGHYGNSQAADVKYNDRLQTLRKRFGDLRPDNKPRYRRATRAGGIRRRRYIWNRIEER